MNVKVIGLGGIGGCLLPVLARYLSYSYPGSTITLIDGDRFEPKNAERQSFSRQGNKAEITAEAYAFHKSLIFRSVPEYLTGENISDHLSEGDLIFLAVDNNATRKLVSDQCEDMASVVLISGGNDFTDGNVQIHVRQNGEDLTLPIKNRYHQTIIDPQDKNPAELGCEALAESAPQLLITNNAIAATMLGVFYAYESGNLHYNEAFVDILTGSTRAVRRDPPRPLVTPAL